MKKITEEELGALPLRGKGRSSHFFNAVLNMKAGEIILIERSEWKRKNPPSTMIRRIEKNYPMKFSVNSLADGSGWAIRRMS